MKKYIYLIVVLALCLVGCQDKPGYVMHGLVDKSVKGDYVYLQQIKDGGYVSVDSAKVSDYHFEFKGDQVEPRIFFVAFNNENNEVIRDVVFVENQEYTVSLGENNTVKAEGLQARYQEIMRRYVELNNELETEYKAIMKNDELSDEEKTKQVAELEKRSAELIFFMRNSINNNIDNPISVYLLRKFRWMFEPEELREFLDNLQDSFDFGGIQEVKSYVTAYENVAVGKSYTDLSMNSISGEPVHLSDYVTGKKVTIVDFWASWCGPCRREIPNLRNIYTEYKDKGLEIVGISIDEDKESWIRCVEGMKIEYPQMSELQGWKAPSVAAYAVIGVPTIIVIDENGIIVARNIQGDELKAKIDELMKK